MLPAHLSMQTHCTHFRIKYLIWQIPLHAPFCRIQTACCENWTDDSSQVVRSSSLLHLYWWLSQRRSTHLDKHSNQTGYRSKFWKAFTTQSRTELFVWWWNLGCYWVAQCSSNCTLEPPSQTEQLHLVVQPQGVHNDHHTNARVPLHTFILCSHWCREGVSPWPTMVKLVLVTFLFHQINRNPDWVTCSCDSQCKEWLTAKDFMHIR